MTDATAADIKTIHAIADRAVELYERLGMFAKQSEARFARYAIAMEIMTVHRRITPLRLDEMLAADDSNFAHDIGGIHRHLDGDRLTDCFMPRFAVMP
jgi:Family of unknown function (DUF6874)